jgi:SAM-dependent methyltransferase
VKLNLGCGKTKLEGFIGIDKIQFPEVEILCDIGKDRWPFDDDSVEEAICSHTLEHLTGPQRVWFFNQLYRVLKKGGKCQIITPHWNSTRAYGDVTHQWPPVCEMFYYYLSHAWRVGDPTATPPVPGNAPHDDGPPDGFCCDFDATWGYSMHPELHMRNQEFQQFALAHYKEAAMDMAATVTKK